MTAFFLPRFADEDPSSGQERRICTKCMIEKTTYPHAGTTGEQAEGDIGDNERICGWSVSTFLFRDDGRSARQHGRYSTKHRGLPPRPLAVLYIDSSCPCPSHEARRGGSSKKAASLPSTFTEMVCWYMCCMQYVPPHLSPMLAAWIVTLPSFS